MAQTIDVTVAAVIERDGRFLMVEEQADGQLVFNQPAGHLEPGESLLEAVVRETLEETGFAFVPNSIIGFYFWQKPDAVAPSLRVAFCGTAQAPAQVPHLDGNIEATHWLTRLEIVTRQTRLRSPMVIRCIDDFQAGTRYPLTCVRHLRFDPLIKNVVTVR